METARSDVGEGEFPVGARQNLLTRGLIVAGKLYMSSGDDSSTLIDHRSADVSGQGWAERRRAVGRCCGALRSVLFRDGRRLRGLRQAGRAQSERDEPTDYESRLELERHE